MLFNSKEFLLFFPIVTLLYFLTPHKFRWIQLICASCIFYASFIPSYLLILFALIIIDFTAGILIEKKTNKKKWLIISIVANLGLLFVFKYYDFFISSFDRISGSHSTLLHLALPIGLSFHTFQSLSYTIEVYRGKQKAIKHLGYYSLYVMFYPQLVAGPIERPYNLLPQLQARHSFSPQNLYEGLRLMAWGFFKKTVIADRLSGYVDTVFSSPKEVYTENIWLGIIFFAVQIYADFSGYSDIALGSARCMGFELMINFNRPYQSDSVREFWKRWHISLSSWFKDYVYIPLGGNKKGIWRKRVNILLTFVLSGLWHGAGWHFIIWGLLHGFYVVVYELLSPAVKKIKAAKGVRVLMTLFLISFAWIFFRASSLQNAADIITQTVHTSNLSFSHMALKQNSSFQIGNFSIAFVIACTLFMFCIEKITNPLLTNMNKNKSYDILFFTTTVLLIIFFGVFHKTSFIYFQF